MGERLRSGGGVLGERYLSVQRDLQKIEEKITPREHQQKTADFQREITTTFDLTNPAFG